MFADEILEYRDALNDELRASGNWIVAHLNPSMPWPVRAQKIKYLGQDFWIIPITTNAYPGVAVRSSGERAEELRERILRFVSVLAWIEDGGASLVSFGGGSHLHAYLRPRGGGVAFCNELDLRYLPEITDPKSKLALALIRDARGLKHYAYSFLTFWRVLEVAVGKRQIAVWMPMALSRITNHNATTALSEIIANGVQDVHHHLYVSGRCAVAHAGNGPIIDPDQPEDSGRLAREIGLIEALAVLAIEENLGVQTSSSIRREHLYELAGFKRLLGDDIVAKIVSRKELPEHTIIDLPSVDVGLFSKGPFATLTSLDPISFSYDDGLALLAFGRKDGLMQIKFALNFDDERVDFDVQNGIYGLADNGSPDWADAKADTLEFIKWYFLNGCLTISDSQTGELLARKDAFIPVNVMVDPSVFDREVSDWRKAANDRRSVAQFRGRIVCASLTPPNLNNPLTSPPHPLDIKHIKKVPSWDRPRNPSQPQRFLDTSRAAA